MTSPGVSGHDKGAGAHGTGPLAAVETRLEAEARPQEGPARLHPEERLTERDATLTGNQVLVSDRVLVVEQVEHVDEEFGRGRPDVLHVLSPHVDLTPRGVFE